MLSIYSYLSFYLTGSFVSLMLSLISSYLILYISLKGQSQDKKRDGGGAVTKDVSKHRLDPFIFNVYICLGRMNLGYSEYYTVNVWLPDPHYTLTS